MKAWGLALIGLFLWVYQSVWTAGWVYEDASTPIYSARPLTTWTWGVVHTPMASHLLNLALMLLLTALLVAFAARLGIGAFGQFAVAGIWLVHPVNTELVAYAASRGELLAAIFVLGACLAAAGDWWRIRNALLIFACLGLGMASKESAAVGLLLVPLVILWCEKASPVSRWVPVGLSASLIAFGIWFVGGLRVLMNYGGTDFVTADAMTWTQWIGLQAAAAHHWLGSAIWLTGLTPDADIDAVPLIGRLVSLGVLTAMSAGVVWLWRRQPVTAFGLAWCLVALLPRFIVQTPQSYLNAHQFALPFMGIVLIAGSGLQRWQETA